MILPQILNLGLILLPTYQWLDGAGPVDYINNHSKDVVSIVKGLPNTTLNEAPIMRWHYISSDLSPVQASSGPLQTPSCTYADCPPLDYIFVPGPANPLETPPDGFTEFIQTRVEDQQLKALLMVCTASILVAQTGVLDGRQVASNKVMMRELATEGLLTHKVNWVGDKRFVVDGKLWSSAGITAGLDLAAEFARTHFPADLVKLGEEVAEYTPNPAQPDPFAYLLDGVTL